MSESINISNWYNVIDNIPEIKRWFVMSIYSKSFTMGYRVNKEQYLKMNGLGNCFWNDIIKLYPSSKWIYLDEVNLK